ncbi:MAG: DUF192 domain-containing protein [Nanoarchaeota archaeon]
MKKLIFLLLLISCSPLIQIKYAAINNQKIPVELAETQEQQMKGLMFRENLTGGMLFIYNEENQRSFWMKNTLIPLDMIFIDKNYKITTIHHALPCKEDPCKIYASPKAKYVLEVNVNFTIKNSINVGDRFWFTES